MNNLRINHAIQFATAAHGMQVRKGNTSVPYIFHPLDVANEVLFYSGLPENELELAVIIAILHDTVEDTIATKEDVEAQFGSEVCEGVLALSKNEAIAKAERFSENLKRLSKQPGYVQVVKVGDRTSNLKNFPSFWDRVKISSYLDEGVTIARTLGAASETMSARLLMRVADRRNQLSLYTRYTH